MIADFMMTTAGKLNTNEDEKCLFSKTKEFYVIILYSLAGSSALHVAVAALHFRQCIGSGSARYIFK